MVKVYDLTTSFSTDDIKNGSSSITGDSVPENIAYTWITVKSVTKNFQKTITNAPFTNAPSSDFMETRESPFSATSRLTSSIALHLPKNLPYSWSNEWSVTDTGPIEQAIAKFGQSGFSDAVSTLTAGLKNEILDKANRTALKTYLQENLGQTSNPFQELFYSGVGFRQFQFSWDFAPQNKSEADILERLIYDLELASHPEYVEGEGSRFFIPDVFNITFVGTRAPKIVTAALTNMTVEYAGNGPKFFSDGHASFVELGLSFTELIPLTKKEIREARELNDPAQRFGGGPQ